VWIGGGYGSTGVTVTNNGVISADGTSTLAGSVSIGGGYGNVGVTVTHTGITMHGNHASGGYLSPEITMTMYNFSTCTIS